MIIAALAAGATAAAQDTLTAAAKDAYAGLKSLLRRKFGGAPDAEAELARAEQEPKADHPGLAAHLAAEGVDRDEEVLARARTLLAEVDPEGSRAGKYRITISDSKGVTAGDHNTVTMTFNEGG
jgi:hypothetical protein